MARRSRARSGTFFLRADLDTNGATFATTSIDISSFVNVLEGELLRIKQVFWDWQTDGGGPIVGADLGASKGCSALASVSTESRTTTGNLSNNDIVSLNYIYAHSDSNTLIDMITNSTSVNPADYDDGYLVATDAIHLNVDESANTFANPVNAMCMLECEIVRLSLSDAQAVLVSQTVG
jgi:hypothetical protein